MTNTTSAARSKGTVYLLHFERPLSHARHYIGFANGEGLEARIATHRSGNGAKIMAAVVEAGIDFKVVRTWEGGRILERSLKRQRNAPRLCPICAPAKHEREKQLKRERAAGRPKLGVPWALTPEERYEREHLADLPEFDDIPF